MIKKVSNIFLRAWIFLTILGIQTSVALSRHKREGQGLVEYALIIALVAIATIAALTAVSGAVNNNFWKIITTELNNIFHR